jgi:hypothetical protein
MLVIGYYINMTESTRYINKDQFLRGKVRDRLELSRE